MSFLGSTSTFGATSTPAKRKLYELFLLPKSMNILFVKNTAGMFSNFTTGTGTTGTATAFGQPAATTAATFGNICNIYK